MNQYLHKSTIALSEWLSVKLPRISDSWWTECVLDNLSHYQRGRIVEQSIKTLQELDLAALLRVANKSWYELRSVFYLTQQEREYLRKMRSVRNNWAHCAGNIPDKDIIEHELGVVLQFAETYGAGADIREDIRSFQKELSGACLVPQESAISAQSSEAEKEIATPTITEKSIVFLKSDPTVKGMVFSICEIDGTVKYEVFVNGEIKTFYADQVLPDNPVLTYKIVDIHTLQSSLTAYQLKNPNIENLYSLNAARIDFVPYQFRPALKIIKSDVPRLLIADSVGVGKTIEAGLILKELQARSDIQRVLVICPKPLVAERKWELEMKRFDEEFIPVDGSTLRQIISDTDRDGVWPERYNKAIIPYSLLGNDILHGSDTGNGMLKSINPGLLDLDPAPYFDMVIVDEAHHIRHDNTQAYAVVKYLCDHADSVIFLTATPLQTSDQDLYTLLNVLRPDVILDQETFKMMAKPNPYINQAVHIIRTQAGNWAESAITLLKKAVRTQWGRHIIAPNPIYQSVIAQLSQNEFSREERVQIISSVEKLHSFSSIINRTRRQDIQDFCIRRSYTIDTAFTREQRELHDELLQFEAATLSFLHNSKSILFMMSSIRRQAASCIYGLAPFIKAITQRRLSQIWDDPEFEVEGLRLDSETSSEYFMKSAKHLLELADNLPEDDPKFDSLMKIIKENQEQENNKIIIFSTFRHTLAYVSEKLSFTGLRLAQIDGSVKDENRYALRSRFQKSREEPDAIDLLLFTEVGSEGLDYQFCNTMINYDLPWNPMRIEQRIGRIDRRGQQSDVVNIYNLITTDTIDADIYHRCLVRIGIFEQSIGECAEILGEISREIQNIVFDTSLTDEERKVKFEQMADNEVRKIQELKQLEEDEKQLFGFSLYDYTVSKEVQAAENPWVSPDNIQLLISDYLNSRLGDGNYILGEREPKTLRFSAEARRILLDDFRKLPEIRSMVRRGWELYLKGSKPNCTITFDNKCAEQNRNVFFITNIHPLVKQAAEYFGITDILYIGALVTGLELKPGIYPFSIYAWEYFGNRPQRKLTAVCEDPDVQEELLNSLQVAKTVELDINQYKLSWQLLEKKHLQVWKFEKVRYKEKEEALLRYKSESLTNRFNIRRRLLQQQIQDAYDEKIKRMRKAELENAEAQYHAQINGLRWEAEKADIHIKLLVNGVLFVEGG
jgi:ERCC4-related helicase